jgi:hypothetical protein
MWRAWLILTLPALAADSKWIQSRSGPVEVVSDAGNRAALEKLGTFEEFRAALGILVGKPDLQMDPPIRLLVMKTPAYPAALTSGRDRLAIPLAAERPIPPSVFRDATRALLERNVARFSPETERGLEDFFSTVEVKGVHVLWGAPPPAAERTRDWARIQLLATKPEYYGKLKILLFNLQRGIADEPAYRNAIGKSKKEFETELDAYLKAGVFTASDGPSRPLNALRDFPVKPLDSGDAELAMADLLTAASRKQYEQMLGGKKYFAEANEGLALLAERDHDDAAARKYLAAATDAGSKNALVWLAYAKLEDDRVKSNEAIEAALELDPNLAEAHYIKGERRHLLEELKKATSLDPNKPAYWDALALVYLDANQFPEAGRAWHAGEQAATDPAEKKHLHDQWAKIENERLDYQDSEKRRVTDEKQQELQRLKDKAATDLRAAEKKINAAQGGAQAGQVVVSWEEAGEPVMLDGILKQVDCLGKQTRVVIEGADHILTRLVVKARGTLACGLQKEPHGISVQYTPKVDKALGTIGELESLQ